MPPTLGYFNFRGVSQPIRMLLAYLEIDYEFKQYLVGPAPDYSKEDWFSVKYSLGLTIPNLPYYIDGEVKMTQSNAIMNHIGRKYNMVGTTEVEKARCDMAMIISADLHWDMYHTYWTPDVKRAEKDHLNGLPARLKIMDEFLGDRKWCVGSNLTIADFRFYDALNNQRLWPRAKRVIDAFPRLQAYMKSFEELPSIHEYLNRDDVKDLPILPMPQAAEFLKQE